MRTVSTVLLALFGALLVAPAESASAANDGYFVVTSHKNPTFYPLVKDGYKDQSVVRWNVPTGDVDEFTYAVDVLDSGGVSIRTLDDWRELDTWGDRGTAWWNGRDEQGSDVATGDYTIRVTASDSGGLEHDLTQNVRVATGTKWFKRSYSTGGHNFDARSHTRGCQITRAGFISEVWLDCWGGRHARVGYGFYLPYELGMRGLSWWVRGTTGCCNPGRVIKSGKRTRPHRLWISVKVTNWRAFDVHRVGYKYWAKRRI